MLNPKTISIGFPGFEEDLDFIRYGDVLVWNISRVSQYKFFVEKFTEGKKVVYVSFGAKDNLLAESENVRVYDIDLTRSFEQAAMEVYDIIESEGPEVHYVFDNISKLQKEWVADFNMTNFFVVTASELKKRNCVAYFAITGGIHSFETIRRIREEATVIFEVFSAEKDIYLLALAVRERYKPKMFLPHRVVPVGEGDEGADGNFEIIPITNGIESADFYARISDTGNNDRTRLLDSWERFFIEEHEKLSELYKQGDNEKLLKKKLRYLYRLVFSSDEKILDIAMRNVSMKTLLDIKARMIGVGSIGGKATGMLLSRTIVQNKLPNVSELLEPHDSFYICSNLYYTFLIKNNCWGLKIRQRTKKGYFTVAEILKEKIMEGKFSEPIREQFIRMLQYYGKSPIIVRSSSTLEDGFGNAFPGKYESIFLVNSGSLEERIEELEHAIKIVYASTMNESVLEYRLKRGLTNREEQMALLVQRVSGSLFQDIYMPSAAGVCFSYNAYRWSKEINPEAGVIRIVMGLGTRAVDRASLDYPRISPLDKPWISAGQTEFPSEHSQQKIDLLDLGINTLSTVDINELMPKMSAWFRETMVERDSKKEDRLRELGRNMPVYYAPLTKIMENEIFIDAMRKILACLQKEYDYPVDVEFALNIDADGKLVINLLQCRPLQVGGSGMRRPWPKGMTDEKTFFRLSGGTMGGAYYQKLDAVISIDPKRYYEYKHNAKSTVARIIGEINHHYSGSEKAIMLLSPGRIGTSSPELGVPVSFAEISNIKVACEVAYEGAGYRPELSFGSHFFLDLVEADIFYAAIFENKETTEYFNPDFLASRKSITSKIIENISDPALADIVRVYDVSDMNLKIISDIASGKTLCGVF